MKIFEWLKGKFSRDKPMNLFRFGVPFFFGKSKAGQNVNEITAMQSSAVYACVRTLAESIAALPLHVYQYRKDGGKEKAVNHPLYFLLHDSPNDEMTSFTFRELLMVHLLLRGNGYAQIVRYAKGGRILSLYPLQANRMTVNRDDDGKIFYLYTPTGADKSKEKSQVRLEQEEVLHIHGLGFDGVIGYSPIAMAKNAIGTTLAVEEFGASFFENGARLSGVLEHPGIIKDTTKVKESWQTTYGGSENVGKVAILEEGMKYQQIGIPPEDAQFLETRKFQTAEIARIFRVPLHLINDLEHATFSNIEHQSREFVVYTLTPWLVRWEQALNKSLFSPSERGKYFVKFNVDGFLRGDYQSRMSGYQIAIQQGIMSVNDVREMEDMNPISDEEGGNLHLINAAMTKLSDAGIFANKGSNKNE